jgi:hypothetical protein
MDGTGALVFPDGQFPPEGGRYDFRYCLKIERQCFTLSHNGANTFQRSMIENAAVIIYSFISYCYIIFIHVYRMA